MCKDNKRICAVPVTELVISAPFPKNAEIASEIIKSLGSNKEDSISFSTGTTEGLTYVKYQRSKNGRAYFKVTFPTSNEESKYRTEFTITAKEEIPMAIKKLWKEISDNLNKVSDEIEYSVKICEGILFDEKLPEIQQKIKEFKNYCAKQKKDYVYDIAKDPTEYRYNICNKEFQKILELSENITSEEQEVMIKTTESMREAVQAEVKEEILREYFEKIKNILSKMRLRAEKNAKGESF